MIPRQNLTTLEQLAEEAAQASADFREACRVQAAIHGLDPQGLAQYVRARVADRVDKLLTRQQTVDQLALTFDAEPAEPTEPLRAVEG